LCSHPFRRPVIPRLRVLLEPREIKGGVRVIKDESSRSRVAPEGTTILEDTEDQRPVGPAPDVRRSWPDSLADLSEETALCFGRIRGDNRLAGIPPSIWSAYPCWTSLTEARQL
jgi:hypothetical protein